MTGGASVVPVSSGKMGLPHLQGAIHAPHLHLTKDAIAEVKKGIEFDNKH